MAICGQVIICTRVFPLLNEVDVAKNIYCFNNKVYACIEEIPCLLSTVYMDTLKNTLSVNGRKFIVKVIRKMHLFRHVSRHHVDRNVRVILNNH